MGENAYCTWDDKAVAKIEKKWQRKKRALRQRCLVRHNKLIEAIEELRKLERRESDKMDEARRDEVDAICVDK